MLRRTALLPLLLAACAEGGGPPTGPSPLTVVAHAGADQVAIGNTTVAVAPAVRVTGPSGPRAGVQVEFTILEGGGEVTEHLVATDIDGVARVGSWKLGRPGATQLLNARVGLANTSVVFGAQSVTGPFYTLTGFSWSVTDGFGVVGEPIAKTPTMIAVDAGFNPVAGVPVRWRVRSGGGTIRDAQTVTGADGTVGIGSWILGTVAGPQSLGISADLPDQREVPIAATALPGPVAGIERLAPDQQVAMVGQAVQDPPRVRIVDRYGNAAYPRQVIFSVISGGGSVDNSHRISASDGTAGVMSWRLGAVPGVNRLRVTADQSEIEFVATGTP
jgi:hypothetical protein